MSAPGLYSCFLASSSPMRARLKPVPTGSMNTRSVKSSQVPGLSCKVAGADALSPSEPKVTTFGPIAPMLR